MVNQPPQMPVKKDPPELEAERHEALAPKLAVLLTRFRQLEELERPDVEPAPLMPERWDGDERR